MVMTSDRLIGVDSGGYPTQPDADAIIRVVDNELMQAMDLTVPLLTLFGGLGSFNVSAVKHSWVEDDLWRRRITTWSSIATSGATSITITGQAHRYPIGTILAIEDELMRITGIVDANTITVTRGYAGTSAAAHTDTTKMIFVGGSSMHESDNWVYRPTPVVSLPYNYCQLDHTALGNSWRRQSINMYGRTGAQELDQLTAQTLAEKTVAIEESLILGQRYSGAAGSPATAGGINYYVTSANGAGVYNKAGAALQLAHIYTAIHDRVNVVGQQNVGRLIVVDRWGYEKISSFYAGSRRLTQDERVGGATIDTLRTPWGDFRVVMHYALQPGNLYILNENFIKVGYLGSTGMLHTGEIMRNDGPFNGRYVYSDITFKVKNVPTMVRIHNYSTTS